MSGKNFFISIIIPVVLLSGCVPENVVETPRIEVKPAVVEAPPPEINLDKLKFFFKSREDDLAKAGLVVSDKQIVKNLTHLQSMDAGGKKYYLLEREAISSMIRSVTSGIYEDCIIVNQQGKIIYTMTNNDIFGKNVKTSLKDSPYDRCYQNHDKQLYIDDSPDKTTGADGNYIFFSSTAKAPSGFSGVVILKISIIEIAKVIPEKAFIVNAEGRYRVSIDAGKIDSEYPEFSLINKGASKKSGNINSFTGSGGTNYYRFFDYANISWIVITPG